MKFCQHFLHLLPDLADLRDIFLLTSAQCKAFITDGRKRNFDHIVYIPRPI